MQCCLRTVDQISKLSQWGESKWSRHTGRDASPICILSEINLQAPVRNFLKYFLLDFDEILITTWYESMNWVLYEKYHISVALKATLCNFFLNTFL